LNKFSQFIDHNNSLRGSNKLGDSWLLNDVVTPTKHELQEDQMNNETRHLQAINELNFKHIARDDYLGGRLLALDFSGACVCTAPCTTCTSAKDGFIKVDDTHVTACY